MPREIVLALNGGTLMDVPVPLTVVPPPLPPVPVPPPVVVPPVGDTSGEKMPPMVYALRSIPNCLARARFTSMIDTSRTTSARGRSFASITRSMIAAIAAVARMVMVLLVLLGAMVGITATPGTRSTVFSNCATSVASACER